MHILISPNIESGDPELNVISDKYQDKDNFIRNSALSDIKRNQIHNTIKDTYPTILKQLDEGTWIHPNPLPLLEENNGTEPLQKGDRGAEWCTSDEKLARMIQSLYSMFTRTHYISKEIRSVLLLYL